MSLRLLDKMVSSGFDRWHTPGHKGKLNERDVTELRDGELFPADCVDRAQRFTATVYGCKHLRYLVNGSSAGIKAAVLAADGDLVVAADSHPAVFEGLELAGHTPVILQNRVERGLTLPLSAEQLDEALTKNPQCVGVLITSPDYFGHCADADRVASVVMRKHGKLLLADSAHGAHFAGNCNRFPKGFEGVADFCNLSAHKTLYAYTQTAYFAVNNEAYLAAADRALRLLGTTSPSYLFYESLFDASVRLRRGREAYERLYGRVCALTENRPFIRTDDFTRLVLDAGRLGRTGKEVERELIEKKIVPETSRGAYVVFIATPWDDVARFRRLARAVDALV